jgi:hypothetical protein
MPRTSRPALFAVASSPRRPAIAARKLSIARLSGNAAGALAFVEVLKAAFERGFFDIGIFALPQAMRDAKLI